MLLKARGSRNYEHHVTAKLLNKTR